jgi:protein TonB
MRREGCGRWKLKRASNPQARRPDWSFDRPLRKREKGLNDLSSQRPVGRSFEFMKLAHFFAISAALHAVAFFCPVPLVPQIHLRFIPVTVISLDEPRGGSGRAGAARTSEISKAAAHMVGKKNGAAKPNKPVGRLGEKAVSADVEAPLRATPQTATQLSEPEKKAALMEYQSGAAEAGATGATVAIASFAGTDRGDPAERGFGLGGGRGQGISGTGQYGSGAGSGGGFSHGDSRLTQVRYRETPKPLYPERARKEGQQGRVFLRVLVDEEGRSKSVEVIRSSGSEILDRAAAEAIKLWRFSPARYGDKPVESWVRIPVDFRLTDARD